MEKFKAEVQTSDFKPWGMDLRQFIVLMHISQFAGFIVPFAGYVLPIVMWASFKDDNSQIDIQGKNIINFMITLFICLSIAALLCFIFIGIPIVFVLAALGIIFPILGAVKAGNDEIYKYPMAIKFLK